MSQSSSQKDAACAPSLFAAFAPLRVACAERAARTEPPRPAAREDRARARTGEDESGPEGCRFDSRYDMIFLRRD